MEYNFFFIFSSLQADLVSIFVRSRSFSQNTSLAAAPTIFRAASRSQLFGIALLPSYLCQVVAVGVSATAMIWPLWLITMETVEPAHGGLAARRQVVEYPMMVDAAIVTDGELG
jgi:hypothetical protein